MRTAESHHIWSEELRSLTSRKQESAKFVRKSMPPQSPKTLNLSASFSSMKRGIVLDTMKDMTTASEPAQTEYGYADVFG